uniref:uncharacterized protein LOC103009466 isoform X1 n=1 Tax=Balaenoptera acutorostrata scammoni TaxID=310752 RepID=A0A383Z538_BALAS
MSREQINRSRDRSSRSCAVGMGRRRQLMNGLELSMVYKPLKVLQERERSPSSHHKRSAALKSLQARFSLCSDFRGVGDGESGQCGLETEQRSQGPHSHRGAETRHLPQDSREEKSDQAREEAAKALWCLCVIGSDLVLVCNSVYPIPRGWKFSGNSRFFKRGGRRWRRAMETKRAEGQWTKDGRKGGKEKIEAVAVGGEKQETVGPRGEGPRGAASQESPVYTGGSQTA